jgi:hypothetical protein
LEFRIEWRKGTQHIQHHHSSNFIRRDGKRYQQISLYLFLLDLKIVWPFRISIDGVRVFKGFSFFFNGYSFSHSSYRCTGSLIFLLPLLLPQFLSQSSNPSYSISSFRLGLTSSVSTIMFFRINLSSFISSTLMPVPCFVSTATLEKPPLQCLYEFFFYVVYLRWLIFCLRC